MFGMSFLSIKERFPVAFFASLSYLWNNTTLLVDQALFDEA
jgi:hypothetical protein